jgi:hypothetical protein
MSNPNRKTDRIHPYSDRHIRRLAHNAAMAVENRANQEAEELMATEYAELFGKYNL